MPKMIAPHAVLIAMVALVMSGCSRTESDPSQIATRTAYPTDTIQPATETGEQEDVQATATMERSQSETATPELTVAVPEPTATPLSFGDMLYTTTFRSGWPDLSIDRGEASATDRGYIFTLEPSWAMWVYTSQVAFQEGYAEIEAEAINCTDSNTGGYGILFHYESADQFRYFIITCSGEFLAYEQTTPDGELISSGTIPDEINASEGVHRIGVKIDGDQIAGYVDRLMVFEVSGLTQTQGDVGVYVRSREQSVSVVFTELSVYEGE